MIPLKDDNPTELRPYVTWGIIGVCVLVFVYQLSLDARSAQRFVIGYGFIPALLFETVSTGNWKPPVPASVTIVTSMFMHGGIMHVAGNMLYLWIFGNNVEDALGHVRFVIFYLICGAAAALAQALADPTSTIPMVGASGAIGGVLGAYVLLYPKARVLVLIPFGIFTQLLRIPALFVLGFWFAVQFLQGTMTFGAEGGGVAFWAHIGGFVAGMVLILFMRRQGVTLWHAKQSRLPESLVVSSAAPTPRGASRIPETGKHGRRRGGPWG